jgi:hypothetical protein
MRLAAEDGELWLAQVGRVAQPHGRPLLRWEGLCRASAGPLRREYVGRLVEGNVDHQQD